MINGWMLGPGQRFLFWSLSVYRFNAETNWTLHCFLMTGVWFSSVQKTCDEWGLWHAVIWGYTLSCPNNEPWILKFIRVVFCEPHLGTVGGDMISSIPFGNHSYGHPPFFRERDASRSPKLCGFEHVFEYFMCYLLLFHLTYRIHLCYIYIYHYISIYGNIYHEYIPNVSIYLYQHHGSYG